MFGSFTTFREPQVNRWWRDREAVVRLLSVYFLVGLMALVTGSTLIVRVVSLEPPVTALISLAVVTLLRLLCIFWERGIVNALVLWLAATSAGLFFVALSDPSAISRLVREVSDGDPERVRQMLFVLAGGVLGCAILGESMVTLWRRADEEFKGAAAPSTSLATSGQNRRNQRRNTKGD